jgi:hypothetical protein
MSESTFPPVPVKKWGVMDQKELSDMVKDCNHAIYQYGHDVPEGLSIVPRIVRHWMYREGNTVHHLKIDFDGNEYYSIEVSVPVKKWGVMPSDFFNVSRPSARKQYVCEFCGELIEKGLQHIKVFGLQEGETQTYRIHIECNGEFAISGEEYFIPHENKRPKFYWGKWGVMERDATFSEDGNRRFDLVRDWRDEIGAPNLTALFVLLNPSKAGKKDDDPTVRKVMGFCRRWGYGRSVIVNLIPIVSTDPWSLPPWKGIDSENSAFIQRWLEIADIVVAAWGTQPKSLARNIALAEHVYCFERMERTLPLYCIGMTINGCPRHPSRTSYTPSPEIWHSRSKSEGWCMVITSRWLRESTKGGSPTKAQLEVLGLSWPPITGWMERLIGVEISEITAAKFISCKKHLKTVLPNGREILGESFDTPVRSKEHWKFCPHCGKEL